MLIQAFLSSALFLFLFPNPTSAQIVPFSPCPLLGPRFPIPKTISTSPIFLSGLNNLTIALDDYVKNLNGTFGPISPSTSFSITLFSTEEKNSTQPFLYEYHHTAPSLANATANTTKIDAGSIYQLGDLTTLFTTWLFLIEAGEHHWDDPVSTWVPELSAAATAARNKTSGSPVNWDDVTLGDLAAHLGGIGRYIPSSTNSNSSSGIETLLSDLSHTPSTSPCESNIGNCSRTDFLSYFGARNRVTPPGMTPIFSNAGFIILGYALESITGRPYAELLYRSILAPLNLALTSYLDVSALENAIVPSPSQNALSDTDKIQGPSNGLTSTPHDTTLALRSILSSGLFPRTTTNRWLKPQTHTSNLVNTVGRPWEIFSLTASPISPVIPVYQVRGNKGSYASHVGLVPDYGTGFVILAVDDDEAKRSPDLNAHADILATVVVPVLEKVAIVEASMAFSGTYVSASNANMTLVIAQAEDASPGLSVTHFTFGDRDIRAAYAAAKRIVPENLSFRLYPTDMGGQSDETTVFRASFQDVTELADAGTPTCDTWRYIDELQLHGLSLDEFVFEMEGGVAVEVVVPAFGVVLGRRAEGGA